MGRPATLLEGLCGHALSFGAQSIEVEYKGGIQRVFAIKDGVRIPIARYPVSGTDAKELAGNLIVFATRAVRTVINGRVYIFKVRVSECAEGCAYEVRPDLAPKPDPSATPRFTAKQGQYLAFIYNYTKLHREAPAETDLERYFRVSPPSIHNMIKTLERNCLIEKTPGRARSIRLLVQPEHLPRLE